MSMRYILSSGFFALLILNGCGGSSSQVGFSYGPDGADKNLKTSTIYSDSGRRTFSSTQQSTRLASLDHNVKVSKKVAPLNSIGPILNKLSARNAINSYRSSKGLRPLKLNRKLDNAAYLHSIDMSSKDKVFHVSTDGSDPWDRVVARGYTPEMATENIGAGQSDFKSLLKLWQASEQHNINLILPDATDMGIALVHDKKTKLKTFWTLIIAKRKK
ncbi:MAG: CAP domain-containing protein [Methyloligellaceae bacterium]